MSYVFPKKGYDAINKFHEGTGRVPFEDILVIKDK
jgi:hypothetical protein